MKQLLTITISIYLLSSCVATHSGSISAASVSKVVYYEDIAYGVSQTERYFGFGGIGQDAMVLEAKRELIKNRPLSANEQYLNFTLDFKNTFCPFYRQTKVTMSADVIKFGNDSLIDLYSDNYKNKLLGTSFTNAIFHIGDSIIDKKMNSGLIVSVEDDEKVRIMYKSKSDKIKTKNVSVNNIFRMKFSYNGYKTGDNKILKKVNKGKEQLMVLEIIGVGVNSVLLKDFKGKTVSVNYSKMP